MTLKNRTTRMAENYFGITDKGKVRSNNEDTFIAEPVLSGQFIAACVIDGVGGYEGGEVAAKLAHDAIIKTLKEDSEDKIKQLTLAVSAANEAIYLGKKGEKTNTQMACVLTLALVDYAKNKFYYAHVGDTRLYLFRDGSLVKITKDHSFVGFLEDSGRLSEEAAMKHPKRNEINKALGFEPDLKIADYIETGESPFLPGDTILLCSDGLSDMIDNQAISAILASGNSLSSKGKDLVTAANNAGGKDNITVVLAVNDKKPVVQQATRPTSSHSTEVILNDPPSPSQKEILPGRKKKSSPLGIFLFLLVLIVLALGWIIYQNYIKSQEQKPVVNTAEKKRNETEQLLVDSINYTKTNEVFILNQETSAPIIISDSIIIDRDTLHIKGNGATLISDSSYSGPAFTLASNCKFILFDSLTLENFSIGVVAQNPVLHFRKVYFRNCKVPVQYNFMFSDRPVINGRFADTVFYNSDISPNNQ